jgi:hypothetical protein
MATGVDRDWGFQDISEPLSGRAGNPPRAQQLPGMNMAWRRWFVRGVVFSIAGAVVTACVIFSRITDSEAIRKQVISKLGLHLVGARIDLSSAHMDLLGGITIQALRLSRKDDPGRSEVALVPMATIFHDKERLLHGQLAIRKLDLQRARLHVRRSADGRWNVSNILGIPNPKEPIPTIVISEGTIVFEDEGHQPVHPIEVGNVRLTLINDPITTLNFKGTGNLRDGEKVHVQGTWQRQSNDITLSIEAPNIPLDQSTLHCLATYIPQIKPSECQIAGKAFISADLASGPHAPGSWTYNVRAAIQASRLSHPAIPLALEKVAASLECSDGRIKVQQLTATSGKTQLSLQANVFAPREDADLDGTLEVEHLLVTKELIARLPESERDLQAKYCPHGPVSLGIKFQRKSGHWAQHAIIQAEDLSICFHKFPYPLEHVRGVIDDDHGLVSEQVVHIDLSGMAKSRRVSIRGEVRGQGGKGGVEVRISGANIPLDRTLHDALAVRHQKIADQFHPTGLGDIEAYIHRNAGETEYANHFLIRFHDATARYDEFPYPLEQVSGILEIEPGRFEFHDFQGSHKGGHVYTRGRSVPAPGGDRLDIRVSGESILMDSELQAALKPDLKRAWKLFNAAGNGRMKFLALVDVPHRQPPDIDVTVTADGCAIRPAFFPYTLDSLTGNVRYARHWVYLKDMQARHGASTVRLDEGRVYIKPDHGVWADFHSLQASPLVPDQEFLEAVPPILRRICQSLQIRDPVRLETRLTVDSEGENRPPVVFWDGRIGFDGASLHAGVELSQIRGEAACRGRYDGHELAGLIGNLALTQATLFKQPFQDIHGDIEVKKEAPSVMAMKGIHARLFDGEVYGPLRMDFANGDAAFELDMTASGVQLQKFGSHNLAAGTQLQGLASARLHLAGQGTEPASLRGSGTVDVPSGRLYNLPLLLDLLKFLGLHLPDGTAFDEAHAQFAIQGTRVAINRLDLYGNSISLRGQGEMNLDGSDINLDFYAVWARIMQYLPPVIKEIPPMLSQNLLRIKMRGSASNPRFEKEPVPAIVDPLRELLQRMGRRS